MKTTRREFTTLAAAAVTTNLLGLKSPIRALGNKRRRAIVFDAFAIFDPNAIKLVAEELFEEKAVKLFDLWRAKQFEYQWLHTLMGTYADFWLCAEDSLTVVAKSLDLSLTAEKRDRLMNSYLNLQTWPEVSGVLRKLKDENLSLAFLSNATNKILQSNVKNVGISDLFEQVLSTDSLKTFKPNPKAYQLAVDALGLAKEEIVFVAFAGWDAAGAKAFGYPTFWMNRASLPTEQLGFFPDASGTNLTHLISSVKN